MFLLIGVHEVHSSDEKYSEDELALFTTREEAVSYEKKSRLPTYKHMCGKYHCEKQYRKKSLLSGYCGYAIEPYDKNVLAVNPKLDI